MAAGMCLAVAGTARSVDTNAMAAATARDLSFAGCRIEVAGVYTQAQLRVALLSGVAELSAGAGFAFVPEPDVDHSRGGGASPLGPLTPAVSPPLPRDLGADTATGAERGPGVPGAAAGATRGSRPGGLQANWGWLAESVRDARERQAADRSVPVSPLPGMRRGFGAESSALPGSDAFDESPFLPGGALSPLAPQAPSPYRGNRNAP